MKDPTLAIRKKYFQLLAGSVTLNGVTVPVYDRVPKKQPQKYIRIADQTLSESVRGKGCYVQEATALIDIVTRYEGDSGGKRESDIIAHQVLTLLVPDNLQGSALRTLDGFVLMYSQLESSNILEENIATKYVIRRLLRLRSSIDPNGVTETIPEGTDWVERDCENLPPIAAGEVNLIYDCTDCDIEVDLVQDIEFTPEADQYLVFYRKGDSDKKLTIRPVGFNDGTATLNQENESVILIFSGSKWLYA